MKTNFDKEKFIVLSNEVYDNALDEIKAMLGKNNYVVIGEYDGDDEDEEEEYNETVQASSMDDVPLYIFGVGVNEENELLIAANVKNVGYGHYEDEFPREWTQISEIDKVCAPYLYKFVVTHINEKTSKENADALVWW